MSPVKKRYRVTVDFTVCNNWGKNKIERRQAEYQVTAFSKDQADRIARKRCEKSDSYNLCEIVRVTVR